MPIGGKNQLLLNKKEMFLLWSELGSLKKVSLHLETAGRINTETGKRYSDYAIWMAAIQYVLYNSDEARQYYIQKDYGFALQDYTWHRFLIARAAKSLKSNKRFSEWMIAKGFELDDHKDLWHQWHNFDRVEK